MDIPELLRLINLGIFRKQIEKEYRSLYSPGIFGNSSINEFYSHDRKHHRLNKFWTIWTLYKSVNDNLKSEMRKGVCHISKILIGLPLLDKFASMINPILTEDLRFIL